MEAPAAKKPETEPSKAAKAAETEEAESEEEEESDSEEDSESEDDSDEESEEVLDISGLPTAHMLVGSSNPQLVHAYSTIHVAQLLV